MLSVLTATGIGIALAEVTMWMLVRRKTADVHFPRSMDTSSIRFFSPQRLVLLAGIHAIFLLCSTLIPLALLW